MAKVGERRKSLRVNGQVRSWSRRARDAFRGAKGKGLVNMV